MSETSDEELKNVKENFGNMMKSINNFFNINYKPEDVKEFSCACVYLAAIYAKTGGVDKENLKSAINNNIDIIYDVTVK